MWVGPVHGNLSPKSVVKGHFVMGKNASIPATVVSHAQFHRSRFAITPCPLPRNTIGKAYLNPTMYDKLPTLSRMEATLALEGLDLALVWARARPTPSPGARGPELPGA